MFLLLLSPVCVNVTLTELLLAIAIDLASCERCLNISLSHGPVQMHQLRFVLHAYIARLIHFLEIKAA